MALVQVLVTTLLSTLLLVPVPVQSESGLGELCPVGRDRQQFKNAVVDTACNYSRSDLARELTRFRSDTKLRHARPGPSSDSFGVIDLFTQRLSLIDCASSCRVNVSVKWCVRLFYTDGDIETCISLDDDQNPVFESTCDAQLLGLEEHLSLPSAAECSSHASSGCLGMTDLDWTFNYVYLTCLATSDSCTHVSFIDPFVGVGNFRQPDLRLSDSQFRVQETDQIVVRADIISPTERVSSSWHHDNVSYSQHLEEDPFCKPEFEECRPDTHSYANEIRSQRVRSYTHLRSIDRDCRGATSYTQENYLIIDNATGSDAGNYSFTVTIHGTERTTMQSNFSIVVECDESSLFEASCNTLKTIVVEKGDNIAWSCDINAPPNSNLSVLFNKEVVQPFSEKDSSTKLCDKYPQVLYYMKENPQHICHNKFTVHIVVCAAGESVVGEYSIVADQRNITGSAVHVKLNSPAAELKDRGVSPVAYAVPVVLVPTIALLVVAVVVVVLIRIRKRKRAHGRSLQQIQSPDTTVSFHKRMTESGQFTPVTLLSPNGASNGHSDPLEFPRNRLHVFTSIVLGEGSFGRVLQAKAEGIVPDMPDKNIVAVKTTKDNATSVDTEELIAELELMKNMEPHENILNLLGHCTTPGGPLCLIVEFARYGNLRDFLRQCEEVVLSLNHKPHIPRTKSRTRTISLSSFSSTQPLLFKQDSVFTPSSTHHQFVFPLPSSRNSSHNARNISSSSGDIKLAAHHPNTAVPLAHTVAPIGHDYINSKGLVYMEDVHNFALQIACGLQHLANMQIVHCDLAARNVLIAEGFVLKIADFGLARDVSAEQMYKKNPRGKIPVKWTAPEALENRVFTTKSDVWSYGVVLWELFTYGHTPYPEVHLGHSYEPLIDYLKEGNRMAQPESCSDDFYELMQKCWSLDPDQRPTPIDIVASLTPLDSPAQDVKSEKKEIVEEDCKTNGVKANGKHHLNEETV